METMEVGTVRIMRGITVNRAIEEVYRFWRDFENFPAFMNHVESVTVDGPRSHWVLKEPAGQKAEWDAEIVEDRPQEFIAWRSLPGSEVEHAGSVEFCQATADRGTEVRVTMSYEPPAGSSIAKLLASDPDHQIRDDLRRFKQMLEMDEILRSDRVPQDYALKA